MDNVFLSLSTPKFTIIKDPKSQKDPDSYQGDAFGLVLMLLKDRSHEFGDNFFVSYHCFEFTCFKAYCSKCHKSLYIEIREAPNSLDCMYYGQAYSEECTVQPNLSDEKSEIKTMDQEIEIESDFKILRGKDKTFVYYQDEAFRLAKKTAEDKNHKFGNFFYIRRTENMSFYKTTCSVCKKELFLDITEESEWILGDCHGKGYYESCWTTEPHDQKEEIQKTLRNDSLETVDSHTFKFKKGSGIHAYYVDEAFRIIAEGMKKNGHDFTMKTCTTHLSDFKQSPNVSPYEVFRTTCNLCKKDLYFRLYLETDSFVSVSCSGSGYFDKCKSSEKTIDIDKTQMLSRSFSEAIKKAEVMDHTLGAFFSVKDGKEYEATCKKCDEDITIHVNESSYWFSGQVSWAPCKGKPQKPISQTPEIPLNEEELKSMTVEDLDKLEKHSKQVLALVEYVRGILKKEEEDEPHGYDGT